MKRKNIIKLIAIAFIGIILNFTAISTTEVNAASSAYPTSAKLNVNTQKMTITLNDNSIISFDTTINTQSGINGNDYNYFVFPKAYENSSEEYYSYIGVDGYKYILTGWKVDSNYKEYFGYTDSNVTYYSEIGGYDAMWEPTVNVFGPDDWVDVSKLMKNKQTELTFTPVYGKCIYINDPFTNMYYDGNLYLSVLNPDSLTDANIKSTLGFDSVEQYKEFLYYYTRKNVGDTIKGNEAWKKYIAFYDSSVTAKGYYWSPGYANGWTGASDKNDGHDVNSAVATMDRAYELVNTRTDFSPYHYVFYMLGNVHEVRVYNGSAKASTNYNYSSGAFTYDATGTYTKTMNATSSDTNYYGGEKTKYKGVTITSATGTRYKIIKRLATYGQYWASSVRFDNVEYTHLTQTATEIGGNKFTGNLSFGSEENLYGRSGSSQKIYQVCEFTRKSVQSGWGTFRTNGAKVTVFNGTTTANINLHQCWSSSISYLDQTVFSIGGNQKLNAFYGGTMTTNATAVGTTNGNLIINVIENATITTFYGTSSHQRFQHNGNREINIRGGKITNLYGAGKESILNGDIDITITGGTIGDIYGGGEAYIATVYGDIDLNISNANVTGSIYGGGKYASVIQGYTGSLKIVDGERILTETPKADASSGGKININIKDTKIGGNVYGSGQGMVNSMTKMIYYETISLGTEFDAESLASYVEEVNTTLDNCDSNSRIAWWNDEFVYPKVNADGSITSYSYRSLSASNPTSNGSGKWQWKIAKYDVDYYLSVAAVQNSTINIEGTSVINGNVFGGGNLGVVEGNIIIDVSDEAQIKGTLYCGGDGTAAITNIELYNPYNGALPKFGSNGTSIKYINTSSGGDQATLAKGSSLGKFAWTNDIRLKESTIFNSIYKGSAAYSGMELTADEQALINEFGTNKYVYSSSYEEVGEVRGNIELDVHGGNIATLYGGCNKANVLGRINLEIEEGTIGTLYGGNNLGGVTHNDITITVGAPEKAPQITNFFGGGNLAKHDDNVDVNINNLEGTTDYLFGGGHHADVTGSIDIDINSGKYNYIFGGGDLGKVSGSTYLNVGDKINNPEIIVNNIVYGGGRGSDTGADASGITTVEGNSTVWIVGMNTKIQNYGSTKLGGVAGDVNVTFDTYRKENATNPYVTMNGIDRATTVSLVNSYIALENIGENGQKEGIKNVGNMNVPAGSGLKVTATSVISGDFNGGGTFYLDSKVSLTIGGNITGKTTLAVNPQIAEKEDNVETPLIIKGTLVYAYMIVNGNSDQNNLICVDDRYADMLCYAYENGTGYFYMAADIPISEQISEILVAKKDINYTEDCGSWANVSNVKMQQDGLFTVNMDLTYNFAVNHNDLVGYQNVSRSLAIRESDIGGVKKYFPQNTVITMIVDGVYYRYITNSDMANIPLNDFVEMEDATNNYVEIKNVKLDENTIVEGKTENATIYSRKEAFRFVVDFTYCSTPLPPQTYIVHLDLTDNNVASAAQVLLAENIIQLEGARTYTITLDAEDRNYIEKDIIPIDTTIKIDALKVDEKNVFISKPLHSRITIKDSNGEFKNLPTNTVLRLGNKTTTVEGGVARLDLIDMLSEDEHDENMQIVLDMSKVADYSLESGRYILSIQTYLKDSYAEKILTTEIFDLNFVRPEGATIQLSTQDGTTNLDANKKLNITLDYTGDVYNPYVKVKVQKRRPSLTFDDTVYEVCDVSNLKGLKEDELKDLVLDFASLPAGYYRVCFEVYGYNTILYSETRIDVDMQ